MNRLILALIVFWPLAALADFDVGLVAYERGEYATALSEFQPLAEAGDARAQNNLGAMYYEGQGVVKDDTRALAWASLAAAQGEANARVARDYLRQHLMPAQIAEGNKLSRELCVSIPNCAPDSMPAEDAAEPSWWQRITDLWR